MVTRGIELPNRIRQRFQRQTHPGTPPGAIVPHPNAPAPIVRLMQYGRDHCSDHEISDVARIPALIDPSGVTWVDVA